MPGKVENSEIEYGEAEPIESGVSQPAVGLAQYEQSVNEVRTVNASCPCCSSCGCIMFLAVVALVFSNSETLRDFAIILLVLIVFFSFVLPTIRRPF